MKICVTGGAGFIGSNLVDELLASGHEVAVVDDLSTGRATNLDPATHLEVLDILDGALASHMAAFRPDAVVHLAAQASVTASLRDPERDRLVNAEGTRRVAAAARAAGARRVISASSAAVYGEPVELPLKEESPKAPVNPYGTSKLEAESLLAAELHTSDLDFASFRFANVYGPRQAAEGEGGVVAIFMARVADGQAPVIHGDGAQTRDFIFVCDVVRAITFALAHSGRLRDSGPAFNVSTGLRISVDELAEAVRVTSGYEGEVLHDAAREGDILHSALDPALAARAFGWRAQTALAEGMSATWAWYGSVTR